MSTASSSGSDEQEAAMMHARCRDRRAETALLGKKEEKQRSCDFSSLGRSISRYGHVDDDHIKALPAPTSPDVPPQAPASTLSLLQ